MKAANADSERLDILGSMKASQTQEIEAAALRLWQQKLGYFSLFAGITTIFAAQAQEVSAKESDKPIPPNVARAAELVKKLNAACSKPELLRRQSNYRLPHQKGEFNMIELLAGSDNCPGAAIPAATYTVGAPFTDTGTTVGANSTADFVQVGCSDYSQVAGPDHIYSFKISARGAAPQIRFTTTSPAYDGAIYILNGSTGAMCPVTPGTNVSPLTNCLQGADAVGVGGAETITAVEMNTLPLNTQLYLFVDSFYTTGAISAGAYTITMQDVTVQGAVQPPANDAPVDINGDGKTDYTVIRNTGGGINGQATWWTSFQDGFPTLSTDWGIASDQFIPADYDGDGKDDFAVFRPGAQGIFFIVRSATQTLFSEPFGITGDDATVVGDYTGDNIDDIAVYRSGTTTGAQSFWFYRSIGSPPGVQTVEWGQNGDFPAPGDYDGDGKYDFVIQRADPNGVNGRFFIREADGPQRSELFGLRTDLIVPGDYDDDGKTDIAVLRDDAGFLRWDFEPSGTAGTTVVSDTWGVAATDFVAQGDYDGDGKTDYAVYRPGNPGTFFVMTVGTRLITNRIWGGPDDFPVANYNEH
ncbi:MAG: VCBS repeat-containing protein [Pyrinomonadaceae bacterium]